MHNGGMLKKVRKGKKSQKGLCGCQNSREECQNSKIQINIVRFSVLWQTNLLLKLKHVVYTGLQWFMTKDESRGTYIKRHCT